MRFICLAVAWLGALTGACGTFHTAKHDTEGVAHVQGAELGMKHLARYGNIIHHASGLVHETSVLKLGKRVSAIHAQIFAGRKRLEAFIAQLDDPQAILHRNADFQQFSLDFKQKLGYRAEDGSLQLAVDFTRVDDEVAQSILRQLQELELMLSTPLRGVEKVLDN